MRETNNGRGKHAGGNNDDTAKKKRQVERGGGGERESKRRWVSSRGSLGYIKLDWRDQSAWYVRYEGNACRGGWKSNNECTRHAQKYAFVENEILIHTA